MKRRQLIQQGGIAGVLAAGVAPAFAQSLPDVKWRLSASWPKSLDTLFGVCENVAKRVGEITSGKFQISTHAAGEIVGGLQILDAVQASGVEAGHTAPYYFFGKNPAFAFGSCLPFGMNARQQNAWWYYGGGEALYNDFLKPYNIKCIPAGNTGAQMGGWYRKEIKSVADLKNLKFRVGGVAGVILARLGVVPQQIAAGDIYPALEKGTIDAAEWVGPYDDEKLGFVKVAKYYYTPGWWEPNSQNSMFVNLKAWDALPKEYQAAFSAACGESNTMCMARYDHVNPTAMKSLISKGALLRRFPESVLDACYKASLEQYDEWSAKHPEFKTMYDSFNKYLKIETDWFQVSEGTIDNYMVKKLSKSKG